MSGKVLPGFVGLTLLLSACGQGSSPAGADPYANGADSPWEYTAPAGQLTPLSLTSGENNLYFEPILSARNGWGPIEIDRSNGEQGAGDGKALTLNGQTYPRGLGTHAGSELRYSLGGTNGARCFNFTADVGVDDEVGSRGSVVFQVYADGVKLYDSGVMTGTSATRRVNVGVVNRQELRLVVTDADNGKSYDHADWALPRVSCATQNPAAGSVDTSWAPVPTSGSLRTAVLTPDNGVLTGEIFARQPGGRRLVVTNAAGGRFEVRRYNPDGSLDSTYGSGGKVTSAVTFTANDAVLQPDGKLVVVGASVGPRNDSDFALARYNANGTPDTSFGQGGLVLTDLAPLQPPPTPCGDCDPPLPPPTPSPSDDVAQRVRLGPGGTIVVLGDYKNMFLIRPSGALARYRADGSLDPGFAGAGVETTTTDATGVVPSLAVESSGDIILSGSGRGTTYIGVYVRRIRADGSSGEETGNFFLGPQVMHANEILDVALQADGKIVVGGYSESGDGPFDGVLVRLNHDLTFDTGFGAGGTGQVILKTTGGGVQQVLIQPDGKIVAVGPSILRVWP